MHDPCKVLVTLDAVAHAAARRAASVAEGRCGIFVDATAGNGHDTVFLAELAGRTGHVYAFDVQTAALGATRNRLEAAGLADRVTLIHAGHENLAGLVPECTVTAILFNLGFLPGIDKKTATHAETTLAALRAAVRLLGEHGVLSVHLYTGHSGERRVPERT